MKLRTHQHTAKHFLTDHNNKEKEKDSRDPEKSLKLNNNENDEAGAGTKTTKGGKSTEPGQEEDDPVSRRFKEAFLLLLSTINVG